MSTDFAKILDEEREKKVGLRIASSDDVVAEIFTFISLAAFFSIKATR